VSSFGSGAQVPPTQDSLTAQLPQLPPQSSSPQTRPSQLGTHVAPQVPRLQNGVGAEQSPQLPPQPLLPQALPSQLGVHSGSQTPAALQISPVLQPAITNASFLQSGSGTPQLQSH
jgi:hypothetical protein